jgi:outer membrane protein assembly complex protein YaeT
VARSGANLGPGDFCAVSGFRAFRALLLAWKLRARPLVSLPFLFAPSLVSAQEKAPWDSPVIDLELRGDPVLSREQLEKMLPDDAVLTPSLVRSLLRSLYASGEVRDAQISARAAPGGAVLIVEVSARLVVTQIELSGAADLDGERLRRGLGLREGQEFSPERMEAARASLQAVLAEAGYRSAEVNITSRREPGGAALRVDLALGAPTLVSEVRFRGGAELETSWFSLSLRAGAVFDRAKSQEDARQLKASLRSFGYFESRVEGPREEESGGDVALVYTLTLGPRYEVDITGLAGVSREEALQALALEAEGAITPSTLSAAAARLQALLREVGYAEASARGFVASRAPGFGVLRFEAKPGPLVRIESFDFPGAAAISPQKLTRMVEAKLAAGLPAQAPDLSALDATGYTAGRAFWEASPETVPPARRYRPKALRAAIQDITAAYHALGYASVSLRAPEAAPIDGDPRYLHVSVSIDEGPQTLVSSLQFQGNSALSRDELSALGPLRQGGPYDPSQKEPARLRVLEAYNRRGYLYANVSAETVSTGKAASPGVELRFLVDEGPEVRALSVEVSGNQAVRRAALERIVQIHPGDLITFASLQEAERRLLSLGIFEYASVEVEQAAQAASQKRVLVTVRERKSAAIEASGGFSSDDGPRGRLALTENNLSGRALAASLRAQVNDSQLFAPRDAFRVGDFLRFEVERNLIASVRNPVLRRVGSQLFFGEIHASHQRVNRAAFGITKNGAGLATGSLIEPRHRVGLSLQFDLEESRSTAAEGVDLDALRATLPEGERDLLDVFEGQTILVSARPRLTLDGRDDPRKPSRGLFSQTDLELARSLNVPGLEGLNFVSLLRVETVAAGYLPVRSLVLEGIVRGGAVLPLSPQSQTPPDRLFFLGGTGSVRGFREEGLLPEDFSQGVLEALALRAQESHGIPGGDFLTPVSIPRSLGGSSFLAGSLVLRGPLSVLGDAQWEAFFDVGNSWLAPLSLSPFSLRKSAGLGVRIQTPIGPARLELAFKLDRRAALGENLLQPHLAIGAL